MTALVVVEGRRFRYRTAVRWLAGLALLAALAVVAGAWNATRPPSDAAIEQARQQYEWAVDDWEENGEQYLADCRAGEATEQESDPDADWGCDAMAPTPEQYDPYRAVFAGSIEGWVSAVAQFLLLLVFAAGVTSVTAELATGSMAMWLTFVPQRGRVFASKVAVPALGVLLPAALATGVAVGGAYGVAALNGALGTVTGELWADLGLQALRVVAVTGVAAAAGAGLGFVLRATAAAIGAAVGWLILVDTLLMRGLVQSLTPWSLSLNLTAWVQGGATYYVSVPCAALPGQEGEIGWCGTDRTLSAAHGGVLLAVVAAVLVLAGWLAFRRRDLD